jgi:hypothetical protein
MFPGPRLAFRLSNKSCQKKMSNFLLKFLSKFFNLKSQNQSRRPQAKYAKPRKNISLEKNEEKIVEHSESFGTNQIGSCQVNKKTFILGLSIWKFQTKNMLEKF